VYVSAEYEDADVRIDRCDFDVTDCALWGGGGAAVFIYGQGDYEIGHCRFVSDVDGPAAVLVSQAINVTLRGNYFEDRGGVLATRIDIAGPEIGEPRRVTVTVEDNVVWSHAGQRGQFLLSEILTDAACSRNTFVNCDCVVEIVGVSSSLLVSQNIFYGGSVQVWAPGGGLISCVDAWPDSLHEVSDAITIEKTFTADPIFCDLVNGEFTLSVESPCSPEHAPEGCGLIGALPVNCEGTAAKLTTWGRIKASFR
jgi:hypothetical protein